METDHVWQLSVILRILLLSIIGASLSEPHHMGSTVKSVFLLA